MYPTYTYSNTLKGYFAVLVIFWLMASAILIYYGYHESFLILNKHHNPYLDYLAPHLTHFGDSLILGSLLLMLLSARQRALAFTVVFSIAISGLLLLSFKYLVFTDWHRPLKVLGEQAGIHFIEGHVEYYNAFPSGHTTTIFSSFLILAMLSKNSLFQGLIGVAAILFSYTRIYLGAHFLGDVLAGSILGTVVAIGSLYYFYPWIEDILSKKEEPVQNRISKIAFSIGMTGFVIGMGVRYLF